MGRWQGQADPPLTDLGKRQAEVAGIAIAEQMEIADQQGGAGGASGSSGAAIKRVISSDLERARHTAEILAAQLGVADVVVDSALRERHAGEWEGLTRVEIDQQWPGAVAERRWPPNFETEQSVAERLLPALRRHCDGLDSTGAVLTGAVLTDAVLMVGHAGVVKTVDLYVGAEEESIPNLAGRWYEVDRSGDKSASWGWENVTPQERVQFVPTDIDLAIE